LPIAVDPGESWDYVLEDERDQEPAEARTVFELKPLTLKDERRVAQLSKGGEDAVGATEAGTFILKAGLCGWRNFRTARGSDVPFVLGADGKVSDRSLEMIDQASRAEIIKAILYRNTLTETDQKN
jgi:hypothetical protein